MRYHDFYLRGYTVSEFGERIVLDLVYDYENHARDKSLIEFSGVVAHHFTLGMKAILTDILEEPTAGFVERERVLLTQIANQTGLAHWVAEGGNFAQRLEEAGLRVWQIYSAIGFSGFVIGKRVEQLADGKGA